MDKKLGQEPAFPGDYLVMDEITKDVKPMSAPGMSKRYWTAVMLAQGLLSNSHETQVTLGPEIPEVVFSLADKLLKYENNG